MKSLNLDTWDKNRSSRQELKTWNKILPWKVFYCIRDIYFIRRLVWWRYITHLIGFVVEKMNKLLGPSLSRIIAPFFLFGILAGVRLSILWRKYQIYQLPHPGRACQMRPGDILAVITHTNIFQLFYGVLLQPFLPSCDLSLSVIFHLFLDPRSAESHTSSHQPWNKRKN